MSNLVPCKTCKKEIAKNAKTCPHCGVGDPGTKAGEIMQGCLGFIVLAVIFLFFVASCEEDLTPEQAKAAAAAKIERDCRDKISAFVMSETFVKRQLKSPSTAEFPSYMADGVSIKYLGECTNLVVAYVDSQNGFGATVRSLYAVKLRYNPKDKSYTPLEVAIE